MDWTSIICAIVALLGTALGSYSGLRLTSYRVEQLEKKVDKHNNFASRVPVVEEQVKSLDHRLEELEHAIRLEEGK
nr:hypothetical protein [uncultured Ruminococcus sp.]